MDVAALLQGPELAFSDRHSSWRGRLPSDFPQGSERFPRFHPRTESVPAGTFSMGRLSSGHRGIREFTKSSRGHQISASQSFHLFPHWHYLILQGPAAGGCGGGFHHLRSERVIWPVCNYGLSDRRTSSARIYFPDRCRFFHGRLTADRPRNPGRISGGRLR